MKGSPYDLPVDEVGAMQNLQTREAGKARRCHIVIVAHTTYVGVGIVGIDNRVAILTSGEVRIPCR